MGASLRWLRPLAALVIFGVAAVVLHRELEHLDPREVLDEFYAIPFWTVAGAFVLMAVSYWLLSFYDLLGLRYVGTRIPYGRVTFTSFIAYAFGHNLFLAGVTGAAVRLRLYAPSGLTPVDVATVSAFCTVMTGLGAGTLAGVALLLEPSMAEALRLGPWAARIIGVLLLAAVGGYLLWGSLHRTPLEIRGWSFRGPGLTMGLAQVALGVVDFVLAAAVLWVLLPPETPMGLAAFAGLYALAFAAGMVSQVPGGLGVFEAVLLFALPQLDVDELLGALLAFRAIYYLAPLLIGALMFLVEEVRAQRTQLARAREIAATYVRPIAPQIAAALTFIAGAVLLVSGVTPSIDARLTLLQPIVPLPLLELSHLTGSVVGLGLVLLSDPLRRRVTTAYHITLALLYAGIVTSLIKGLGVEQAAFLALVLAVLVLGRDAFYRPAFVLAHRFTPGWTVSIVGVIATTVWIGWLAHRHVQYSDELWWTFAFNADAPRMLRASLLMSVGAAGWLAFGLLRPAGPEADGANGAEGRETGRTGGAQRRN